MEIKTLIVIYLPIHGANDTEKYKMFKMQLYNVLVKRFTQNVKHDMSNICGKYGKIQVHTVPCLHSLATSGYK